MCEEIDEDCDAWTSKWRKARKEHVCLGCQEEIRPGDRYRYTSGIHETTPFSQKHCARCWRTIMLLEEITGVWPDPTLNCGEIYEGTDERMLALAFMTPDEAQKLVAEHA